ncbi:MAG: hypothetical protein IRZ17_16590 [Mycolicibacterium hassiacum]|uniref:hypothetical protein n=1 Tax=Mycolicibacterium hassiacum TaxID=46351 RepID=UPI0023F759C6|nr:hypothetical protein [Mycolicibacterium hassiacum]MBX5488212.1 hypothetical protein [Mycolicibacterium hassiacum]
MGDVTSSNLSALAEETVDVVFASNFFEHLSGLPCTTVGRRLPPAWLLRLYLHLPPMQWALGKRTVMVASRS